MGPLNDQQSGEVVSPQKLLDQLGHEADDITPSSGLMNSNEAEVRASASVLQVIDFVHQVSVVLF